jgi:hypothetical protein
MTDSPQSRFRLPHWGWFLLMAVVLVVAALGLSIWMPHHREQAAIREVERIGGSVVLRHAIPPELQRLLAKLGIDPIYEVWQVDLGGSDITDADLSLLHRLPNIESLCLNDTNVSDAGLNHLHSLTRLRVLNLSGTYVSNAGLIHLKPLTGLRELYLDRTSVTASGMKALTDLIGLMRLSLVNTDFSNAGLYDLRTLKTLQHLNLSDTLVTDSGVRQHLTKMHNLYSVCFRGTKVTYAGVAELQKALPRLSIEK